MWRTETGEKGRKGERKGEEKREERREERGKEREEEGRERRRAEYTIFFNHIAHIGIPAEIGAYGRIRALGLRALERPHPGLAIGCYHNGKLTHGACICAVQGIFEG